MLTSIEMKKVLQGILTENEIKLYLTILEGPISVQELAKRAGVDRSNAYRVIRGLVEKGLVNQEIRQRGKKLVPEHPKKIVQLAGRLRRKLRRQEWELQELLPEFLSHYQGGMGTPRVRLYEGKEGWLNVSRNTLEGGAKEILFIASVEDIYQFTDQKEYDEQYYIPTRIERGIHFRQLLVRSRISEAQREKDEKEFRQTRYLSKKAAFKGAKFIYGNEVAYMTAGEPLIGIVISSQLLADMERVLFEELWQNAT